MQFIYHITRKTDWAAALTADSYAADSLAIEGFIHCSTVEQVIATANRIFCGRRDLILLCVDTEKLAPEIRYENLEGGISLYPHIYGALAIAAVAAVYVFPPRDDGSFELPAALKSGMPD